MKHITPTLAMLAAGIALAGCASAGHETAARSSTGTASAEVSQPASTPRASVQLIWHQTGKFFGDTRVWYVARVTNPGGSPASVALDVRVLDSTGTIVGSSQETLPNIPAHSQFDYIGYIGGGAFSKLAGIPSKIEITQPSNPFGRAGAVQLRMLKTSEITLKAGSTEDTNTDAPYSYNMTAKVTNTTGAALSGGVTQQIILYDQAGKVVGGDTAMSDNVPETLPAGMSYREQWTGIPAVHPAVRAAYTVWPQMLG